MRSTRNTSGCTRVSEEELRAQTAKLRGIIAERARPLEQKIAELRERKHATPDAERARAHRPRDRGPDGKGGLEEELREAIAESLDEILPEAFATVREAAAGSSVRASMVTGHETPWNMVHYDVQLIGGIQLHIGKIAEMATGEGKTLVATLPLYLNALAGTRRASRHGELVSRPARLAVDGPPLHVARPHRRLHRRHRAGHRGAPRRISRPTSRTAPTTSSASTTCATTWSSSLDQRVQRAALVRDRRRSGLRAHR